MALAKTVVETREPAHGPVSEHELDVGIAYAYAKYERKLNRDLLRVITNTTLARCTPLACHFPFW